MTKTRNGLQRCTSSIVSTLGEVNEGLLLSSHSTQLQIPLLKISSDMLLVCRYQGDDSLVLVEAQTIKSVIVMVPFMEKPEGGRPRRHDGWYFVVEKPGLSLAELGIEEGLEVLQG